MKILILCALTLIFTVQLSIAKSNKKVVCYYATWATYRGNNGNFNVENIDPYLCTHIIYAFYGLNQDGTLKSLDPHLDLEENWGRGYIKKFNNLKSINPELKTIIGIGGYNFGSQVFSNIAANPTARQRFAQDAIEFCLKYNFDGIDVDWEYPGQRGGIPADKQNYILLLEELYKQLSPMNLSITAAVVAAEYSAAISYDIPNMMKYLDFVNLMTYDFHGSWDSQIGINSPLFRGPSDITTLQRQFNVNASAHYWLVSGTPKSKLNIGIPFYGRTFTLMDSTQTDVGALSVGPGNGGQHIHTAGTLNYIEFCEQQLTILWIRKWENTQCVPYAYYGNQWIGYDDQQSIMIKADYVNTLGLGGVMVWTMDTDDFRGICGNGKYPLLTTINAYLVNDNETNNESTELPPSESEELILTTTTTTTESPLGSEEITEEPIYTTTDGPLETQVTTTEGPTMITEEPEMSTTISTTTIGVANTTTMTTTITTTTNLPNEFVCDKTFGYYTDPIDCRFFYSCSWKIPYRMKCPSNLVFNQQLGVCDWSFNVDCISDNRL